MAKSEHEVVVDQFTASLRRFGELLHVIKGDELGRTTSAHVDGERAKRLFALSEAAEDLRRQARFVGDSLLEPHING